MPILFDRRELLIGGFAASLVSPRTVLAGDSMSVPIADMHAHLFFFGSNTPAKWPLRKTMARGGVTLAAWSIVGDVPWIRPTKSGLKQVATPKAGEASAWFRDELKRVKRHLDEQELKIVKEPQDVGRAQAGEPHVVLAVEGASFLDDDPDMLTFAYDEGVRHVQLVHYIRNTLGDFQTGKVENDGLTTRGTDIVSACNRLGILIDLAHCTPAAVTQALAVSKVPMVWSHGSVSRDANGQTSKVAWKARQLPLPEARAIAQKGGVVGLWPLRSDVGGSVAAYADRLTQMADWLGEDHVGFGTDMNAISNPAIRHYGDLRSVLDYWAERGVDAARIRKIAIENYARVLKQALGSRES